MVDVVATLDDSVIAQAIKLAQGLSSSPLLVMVDHGDALGALNNATAAGWAWDVGVVLVFVFLQFSRSKIMIKDDVAEYWRDGNRVMNGNHFRSVAGEGPTKIFPGGQLPTMTPSSFMDCTSCLRHIPTKKGV